MVAVIKSPNSIHRAFNYNEQKVKKGVAECLLAENYPIDVDQLTSTLRLNRLLHQVALNENVKRNSIHISLNFAPGEQLSSETLRNIATDYMEQIGFGEQPYLVYQHYDAGHPHLHVVSINIRADGRRIDTRNIGRNQSETARKAIELKYGLVKAEDHKRKVFQLKPISAERVMVGKTDLKRAITNVLDAVLPNYSYTSITELNALLGLYNVVADRGAEGSKVYQHDGLYYRALNQDGEKVGVPIKASDIHNNPGLKFLQHQFKTNQSKKNQHKLRLKNTLDLAFQNRRLSSINQFQLALKKEGIDVVIRRNREDIIYGITYIDHKNKCVFNGSDISSMYSANAIKARFEHTKTDVLNSNQRASEHGNNPKESSNLQGKDNGVLDVLLQAEHTYEPIPYQLRRSRKRRKRNQKFNNQ